MMRMPGLGAAAVPQPEEQRFPARSGMTVNRNAAPPGIDEETYG